MAFRTSIPGLTRLSDAVFEEQIVDNLIGFFDWALLSAGGFTNVKRPSAKARFNITEYPAPNSSGKFWRSVTNKQKFVWEYPINYNIQPVQTTGIYVNDVLVPFGSGYYVDYKNGEIVFESPKPPNTKVEMDFAYRRYNFYDADSDWFQQVVIDRVDEVPYLDVLKNNQIILPAVIIEVVGGTRFEGLEIGSNRVIETQPVLFHIIADTDEDRNKMVYMLKRMYNETIWFYDTNKIAAANKFPLNQNGALSSNPLMYPQLLEQFAWKRCTFSNIIPQDITPQLPMSRAVVRANLTFVMP